MNSIMMPSHRNARLCGNRGPATAPCPARGRYLAAFQYAFTVPGVIAPAAVALFSVAVWLPWLVVGTCAGLAVAALRWLAGHLPADARRLESVHVG